jgi:hypothetical protein
LTYFSPKQRIATAQFHKIISVDTPILRYPKQYIIGFNHHHIRPMISVNWAIEKNTCLFCDRAQYNFKRGMSDGVAPTVCALTVAPFLKSPERRDLLLN